MLSAADLRACAGLLELRHAEHLEQAQRARRADPRDAHEAEDAAAELLPVLRRVRAAAQVQAAYEAQLSVAAAEADAPACADCGERPPDPADARDGLCAECREF